MVHPLYFKINLMIFFCRCVKRLADLSVDEVQDLFMTVIEAQKLTESYFKSSSSTISVQDGAEAGQTVEHVHVHILPRHMGDFANNDDIYEKLQTHDKGIYILFIIRGPQSNHAFFLKKIARGKSLLELWITTFLPD